MFLFFGFYLFAEQIGDTMIYIDVLKIVTKPLKYQSNNLVNKK